MEDITQILNSMREADERTKEIEKSIIREPEHIVVKAKLTDKQKYLRGLRGRR